jgi:hypothetical protein
VVRDANQRQDGGRIFSNTSAVRRVVVFTQDMNDTRTVDLQFREREKSNVC